MTHLGTSGMPSAYNTPWPRMIFSSIGVESLLTQLLRSYWPAFTSPARSDVLAQCNGRLLTRLVAADASRANRLERRVAGRDDARVTGMAHGADAGREGLEYDFVETQVAQAAHPRRELHRLCDLRRTGRCLPERFSRGHVQMVAPPG